MIRQSVKAILRMLRSLCCNCTVVEIIPIGRWGVSAESQRVVKEYNCFLRSFGSSGVSVVNGFSAFCCSTEVNLNLYCSVIGSFRRVDRVHPNGRGLAALRSVLDAHP